MLADVQGISLTDDDRTIRNIAGEELVQNQGGSQRADNLGVGIPYSTSEMAEL